MKKKIIREEVKYPLDWTYGVDLKKIKDDIVELQKLGVSHIEIDHEDNYGSYSISVRAFRDREETKDERKERLAKEKNRNEQQKQRELDILQKLKAKYEQ